VQRDRATLNARGTANNGPATSVFEYWPTGRQDVTRRTRRLAWPAGASGPIVFTVTPLRPGTPYSFRLCGADKGQTDVCAQTRSFTTSASSEDLVSGSYERPGGLGGTVDAASRPSGENPRGSVSSSSTGGPTGRFTFSGNVSCLKVVGHRGVVGAEGSIQPAGAPGSLPATSLLTVDDGVVDDPDTVGESVSYTTSLPPPPPDCDNASFAGNQALGADDGDLMVFDAAGG
jgi:hypothetical protein